MTTNRRDQERVVPPGGDLRLELPLSQSPKQLKVTETTPFSVSNNYRATDAPIGYWKDSLWSCFRLGPCHVSLWNSACCPQILMAQVLTRMHMNWFGESSPENEWRQTFPRMLYLVGCYWFLTFFLAPATTALVERDKDGNAVLSSTDPAPSIQSKLYNLFSLAFGFYTLIVLAKLRRAVRLRYEIPLTYPVMGQMEDCCLSFWCGCCAVAQIARHTCDYEHQPASCCCTTGLGTSHWPRNEGILTV